MENRIVLRAGMKRHKGSLAGIFILVLMVSAALSTVLSIWTNASDYIRTEMERAGFGDVTAWVSDVSEPGILEESILSLEEAEHVESQSLIYTEYEAAGNLTVKGSLLCMTQKNGTNFLRTGFWDTGTRQKR